MTNLAFLAPLLLARTGALLWGHLGVIFDNLGLDWPCQPRMPEHARPNELSLFVV